MSFAWLTRLLGWLLVALLPLALTAQAQDLQPVPPLTARVIDQTGTLSPAQREALESRLAAQEAERGTQIVVLMVPTTAPEDIAAYAHRVADTWKIGRREVGDGLLVVVALQDRRLRIEVAKTLEGAIPDLAARRIIDTVISPAFRQGDYAGGLQAGLDHLIARINGEDLPLPGQDGRGRSQGTQWEDLAVFLFVGVPIFGAVLTAMLGRRLGSLATSGLAGFMGWSFTGSTPVAVGAGLIALVVVLVLGIGSSRRAAGPVPRRRSGHGSVPVIWGGGLGGGSWGGGGWGGGGGFSSGGGGDFGGGGASGDW